MVFGVGGMRQDYDLNHWGAYQGIAGELACGQPPTHLLGVAFGKLKPGIDAFRHHYPHLSDGDQITEKSSLLHTAHPWGLITPAYSDRQRRAGIGKSLGFGEGRPAAGLPFPAKKAVEGVSTIVNLPRMRWKTIRQRTTPSLSIDKQLVTSASQRDIHTMGEWNDINTYMIRYFRPNLRRD
jgi:hypothetical protein